MDLEAIGKIGGALATIGGIAIKWGPKSYRWLRSWTIVKRTELERLKGLEAKPGEWPPRLNFIHSNFLWILTEQFWRAFEDTPATGTRIMVLREMMTGPLCATCQRDVSAYVRDGAKNGKVSIMCPCGRFYKIAESLLTKVEPVDTLIRYAYTEAQAAARRRELLPRG